MVPECSETEKGERKYLVTLPSSQPSPALWDRCAFRKSLFIPSGRSPSHP